MINAKEITDAFLEEIEIYTKKIEAPRKKLILPRPEKIALVCERVFWASQLTEEGRFCRPNLIYIPRNIHKNLFILRLEGSVELTQNNLRKLSQIQGTRGSLVWDVECGTPEITGVLMDRYQSALSFFLKALRPGYLVMSGLGKPLIASQSGEVERLSHQSLPESFGASQTILQLLSSAETANLFRSIQTIVNKGHGGAIWILHESYSIEKVKVGRSLKTEDYSRLAPKDTTTLLESIGHLAAVDGAVVIGPKLQIYGFGSFIDIDIKDREVIDEKGDRIFSTQIGGGRHRSAIEFCARFPKSVAVVISEDGSASLVFSLSNGEIHFIPFSLLEAFEI